MKVFNSQAKMMFCVQ